MVFDFIMPRRGSELPRRPSLRRIVGITMPFSLDGEKASGSMAVTKQGAGVSAGARTDHGVTSAAIILFTVSVSEKRWIM